MKSRYLFLIILGSIIFVQCRSGKAISKAIAPRDTAQVVLIKNAADSLLLVTETRAIIKKSFINYKTFNAKIKLDIETSKGKKPDLIANVRIIKDSAVWISISLALVNYELFRALITKDSVILVDKQEKEVHYRSINYLQELTNIPFDLKTIQDVLVGNVIFLNEENINVRKFEKLFLVASIGKDFKNLMTYTSPQNLLQHCKLDDVDIMQNRTADFSYDDYHSNYGFPFAERRQIIVSEKNKLDIRMFFRQYEFNKELSVSFSVPKSYKKN
jgi:Domain of unknown function (DUF4292)